MSDLGTVLEAMVTADTRHQHVSIAVVSRYDNRYLSDLVDPALGTSVAPLTAKPAGLARLLPWRRTSGSTLVPSIGTHVIRASLRVSKPDHWRYEQLGPDDAVITTSGCDGQQRWVRSEGHLHTWRPQPQVSVYRLPEVAWQDVPHVPLREILDPALTLPAITIEHTERVDTPYGRALRLHGTPRSADLIESALISPWADACALDVHADAGVVLAASNTRRDDWELVTHEVTELDLDAHLDPAIFMPSPETP